MSGLYACSVKKETLHACVGSVNPDLKKVKQMIGPNREKLSVGGGYDESTPLFEYMDTNDPKPDFVRVLTYDDNMLRQPGGRYKKTPLVTYFFN